jgi:hypothetical protein
MYELPVAAGLAAVDPTVSLNYLENVANFHEANGN